MRCLRSIEIRSDGRERMQRRITERASLITTSGCGFEAAMYNSLGVGGRPVVEIIPDIENGQVQLQLKISQCSHALGARGAEPSERKWLFHLQNIVAESAHDFLIMHFPGSLVELQN